MQYWSSGLCPMNSRYHLSKGCPVGHGVSKFKLLTSTWTLSRMSLFVCPYPMSAMQLIQLTIRCSTSAEKYGSGPLHFMLPRHTASCTVDLGSWYICAAPWYDIPHLTASIGHCICSGSCFLSHLVTFGLTFFNNDIWKILKNNISNYFLKMVIA